MPPPNLPHHAESSGRLAWVLFTCAVVGAAAYRASVTEDAFITLRVLDNLLSGHGLRYNVDERVQVFTHPLWALLSVPFVWGFEDPKWALTWLGLLCTGAAFGMAAWPHRKHGGWVAIAVAGPWLASESLVRYATTGLENSLSHLCIAWFAWLRLYRTDARHTPWEWLALAATLATTNRLDACLLFVPACLGLALRARNRATSVPLGRVLLAMTPLLAWLAFATVYYGSPIPNTAAAKLPAAIGAGARVAQGFLYLRTLVAHDLVSAVWLGLMITITAASTVAWRRTHAAKHKPGPGGMPSGPEPAAIATLGMGGLLHVAYVIAVGGDYLSGRFWSPTVMLAVCLVAAAGAPHWHRLSPGARPKRMVAVGLLLALGCIPRLMATTDPAIRLHHVQTRAPIHYALQWNRGAPTWQPSQGAVFALQLKDLTLARQQASGTGPWVLLVRACGLLPFSAGPELHVIDALGLTDPLMARIQPECPSRFRPGHDPRVVPPGYMHARRTGRLDRMPADLRTYYAMLRQLTRGPLFSRARLAAFWDFQTGTHDPLLAAYNHRLVPHCSERIME